MRNWVCISRIFPQINSLSLNLSCFSPSRRHRLKLPGSDNRARARAGRFIFGLLPFVILIISFLLLFRFEFFFFV